MEQETFQQLPAAPFPAPPPFWKHFTKANIDKLAEIDASADTQDSDQKLPLGLLYLRPPPPPPATTSSDIAEAIPPGIVKPQPLSAKFPLNAETLPPAALHLPSKSTKSFLFSLQPT